LNKNIFNLIYDYAFLTNLQAFYIVFNSIDIGFRMRWFFHNAEYESTNLPGNK